MAKTPIFFIHGMWSTPADFKHVQPVLEAAGHKVIAADYRAAAVAKAGSLAQVGLADYVSALEAMVRELAEAPVIVGHSMGGLIAQLLSTRVKPAGLVLLSTAPSNGTSLLPAFSATKSIWGLLSRWGFWREETSPSRADAMYGVYNNVPAKEADAEFQARVPDSGRVLAQIAFAAFDRDKSATVDYASVTCPALVIVGDQDRITPVSVSRAAARRLPGPVTYKEMPGFGHWIVGVDGSPKVADAMLAFFSDHGL